MAECTRCGSRKHVIEHHTSYENDETVPLCRGCHMGVHGDEDDPLYPDDPENKPYDNSGIRPEIDISDETYAKIKEYASENGITIPIAWRRVVKSGIEALNIDVDDTEDD